MHATAAPVPSLWYAAPINPFCHMLATSHCPSSMADEPTSVQPALLPPQQLFRELPICIQLPAHALLTCLGGQSNTAQAFCSSCHEASLMSTICTPRSSQTQLSNTSCKPEVVLEHDMKCFHPKEVKMMKRSCRGGPRAGRGIHSWETSCEFIERGGCALF